MHCVGFLNQVVVLPTGGQQNAAAPHPDRGSEVRAHGMLLQVFDSRNFLLPLYGSNKRLNEIANAILF